MLFLYHPQKLFHVVKRATTSCRGDKYSNEWKLLVKKKDKTLSPLDLNQPFIFLNLYIEQHCRNFITLLFRFKRSPPTWNVFLGKVKSVSVALPSSQHSSHTWQQVCSTEEFFLRPQVNQFQPAATLTWNTSENPRCSRSSGGDASGTLSSLCVISAVSEIKFKKKRAGINRVYPDWNKQRHEWF